VIVNLLQALESGADPATVKGILCRSEHGITATPGEDLIPDLDSLGFPHELAPAVLHDYGRYPPQAFQYVMATRGCPNRCFFCSSHEIWGHRVRVRSPENVVDEITRLRKRGLDFIHFDDDTFGVTSEYLRALAAAIKKHCPGLRWSCETHVRLITEENLAAMKAAGCCAIQLGIESGSNQILKLMRKGFSIEEARSACGLVQKHGIGLETFFMVGFPQETEETIGDTLKAIAQIECDKVIYSIFTPYPGTEAFAFCKEQGLIGATFDLSRHCHQSPANAFCAGLTPERFRALASQVESLVSDKNRAGRRFGQAVLHA
jgi:anaerobic magnesium-protoporphyrin IX monomethyl ester cyclase